MEWEDDLALRFYVKRATRPNNTRHIIAAWQGISASWSTLPPQFSPTVLRPHIISTSAPDFSGERTISMLRNQQNLTQSCLAEPSLWPVRRTPQRARVPYNLNEILDQARA